MKGIKQFIHNERGRLERINVDKIYYRHLMTCPEICITFKDTDYKEELENDYDYFIDNLSKLDVDSSVVPVEVWMKNGCQKWGWEEICSY